MKNQSEIINSDCNIAICGTHVVNDAIHVGIYWNLENEQEIIHFLNGNKIPVVNAKDACFVNYKFNEIQNFPEKLLPSLAAVAELISENKLNKLRFNREGVIYNGGKFEFNTGNFNASDVEKIMNCGVFVIALLNTFEYKLLDWNSWPNQNNNNYLDDWLTSMNIPKEEWELYYNQVKQIRGKHVIVCPSTPTKPSPVSEAENLANELIASL